jgi:hypothetical protein
MLCTAALASAGAGPQKLRIVPADAVIPPSSQLQYHASFAFIGGAANPAAQKDVTNTMTWTSSDTSIATIDRHTGLASSGTQTGTTIITAARGPLHTSVPLTVSTATLKTITVVPASASVPLGRTQQFSAQGNYSDATQHDVTSVASWSSDSAAASVNPFGLASTHAKGTANISAAFGGLQGSAALTITDPVLDFISVAPSNPTVTFPNTLQLAATGIYSDGSMKDLTTTANWSSANTAVATVAAGLVTSKHSGIATITAVSGNATGQTMVTVIAVLSSIVLTPANASVKFPATLQLAATGNYNDGSSADLSASATWNSAKPQIVTISGGGLAASVSAGSTQISATEVNVTGSTTLTVTGDPLGTVSAPVSITCPPGGLTGSCVSINVSCPSVADEEVIVKVIPAAGPPKGTITFISGGGGNGFYDIPPEDFPPYGCLDGQLCEYAYGSYIISTVANAGFTAAILEFNDVNGGWIVGPGGMRHLACRPATAVKWVYDNIHYDNTKAPYCATGNSAGSSALAYSLSHYGLGPILAMIEGTGGPPFSRIDHGCFCDQAAFAGPCSSTPISTCYPPDIQSEFIDLSYGAPLCTNAYTSGDRSNAGLFLSDSILSGADAMFSFPTTDVHSVFGGLDLSLAVPEGWEWNQAVTSTKSAACVANAGHAMPSYQDAANQIVNDLETYCKLQ